MKITSSSIRAAVAAAAVLAALVVAVPGAAGATPEPSAAATAAGAFLRSPSGRFTPLGGIPGATVSAHVDLNNRGQVVGAYLDAEGAVRSFVKDRRGRVTTFVVPGAAATLAGGINDRGQVAGTYLDAPPGGPLPPGAVHGFVRQPDGRITTIDLPGRVNAVTDINNRGQVVGQTFDAAGQGLGVVRDPDGRVTIIELPGPAAVQELLSLNDRGQVAGTWDDRFDTLANEPNSRHAFVWDRGRLARFDVPGSLATGALGINNRGQVTGAYDDAAGRHHGFVRRWGRVTTIDAPGRTVTDAYGINDRGQIVIPDLGTGLVPVTR
jgi:uncharacterized membrane protein